MEFGPIIASFQYRRAVHIRPSWRAISEPGKVKSTSGSDAFASATSGMGLTIHLWGNGKAVATEARHPNMVAMAAVHWRTQIESRQAFVSEA